MTPPKPDPQRCHQHNAQWARPTRSYLCGCAIPFLRWKRMMDEQPKEKTP